MSRILERALSRVEYARSRAEGRVIFTLELAEHAIRRLCQAGTISLAHDVSSEARAKDGKWTADGHITSKAFKSWFGDWEGDPENASKVVDHKGEPEQQHSLASDEHGKPVIMYHGTSHGGFTKFSADKVGKRNKFGPGFYFTPDEKAAKYWSEKKSTYHEGRPSLEVKACYLNIRKPFDVRKDTFLPKDVGLNGDKPIKYDEISSFFPTATDYSQIDKYIAFINEFPSKLAKLGYDGMIINDDRDKTWIAFRPNQIKSIQNSGTFDANNDDINLAHDVSHEARDASGRWTANSVERDLQALIDDTEQADRTYNSIPDSAGGKIINTDTAREISPSYRTFEDKMRHSIATNLPAGKYAKDRLMRELTNRGTRKRLLVTAGGPAAGKSTSVSNEALRDADLIWDTTMASHASEKYIEAALKTGWDVQMTYVHTDPEHWVKGYLNRTSKTGRWDQFHKTAKMHGAAQKRVLELIDKYKDNPSFHAALYHNNHDTGATKISYNDIAEGGDYHLGDDHEHEAERELDRLRRAFDEDLIGLVTGREDDAGMAEATATKLSGQPEQSRGRRQEGERSLATAHCPAGYTHMKPLVIAGRSFIGGQFIPPNVMANASADEKAKVSIDGKPPAASDPGKTGALFHKGAFPREEPPNVYKGIKRLNLTGEDREIETRSIDKLVSSYRSLRQQYLNPARGNAVLGPDGRVQSVAINTDEWRDLFPGYKGTNAHAVHAASSAANKKLLAEMLPEQKGKGNNTFAIYAGGGGSGKGTAIKDYFDESKYPIRLDSVTDDAKKAVEQMAEAEKMGYKTQYIFVDRKPKDAWGGVVGRALTLRKEGKIARTVPIEVAMKGNIDARRAAIEILAKAPPGTDCNVLDNVSGSKVGRRLITDRTEAIAYLQDRLKEDEISLLEVKAAAQADIIKRQASGEIPTDIAHGLMGGEAAFEAYKNGRLPELGKVATNNPAKPATEPGKATNAGLDQPGRRPGDGGEQGTDDADGASGLRGTPAKEGGVSGGTSEEDYLKQAMDNLMKTSRTAQGTVDTSASKGKADKMAEGLTGDKAAQLANNNFKVAVKKSFAASKAPPQDGASALKLADDVASDVNKGIVKDGQLLRTDDSTKFPYTGSSQLELARHQFGDELAKRLSDAKADPVETAAWIEWRVNLTDHPYSDGVGKASKALAAIPLMRAGLPLPNYPDNKAFFAYGKHPVYDPAKGGETYLDEHWQKFLAFYRTLMPNNGTNLSLWDLAHDVSDEPRDEMGRWTDVDEAAAERRRILGLMDRRDKLLQEAEQELHKIPESVRKTFGDEHDDQALGKAIKDVVSEEYPEAKDMDVEKIDAEYDLEGWKDEIADKAKYYQAIDSPKFKEWFGQSHVKEDGKPLLVHHGSEKEIDKFDLGKQGTEFGKNRSQDPFSPNGFWFAKDKKATEAYGGTTTSAFVKLEKPIYLSVSDMMKWDDKAGGVKYKIKDKDVKQMIKDGHDGIIFKPATQKEDDDFGLGGEWNDEQYVVFKPDHIKKLSDFTGDKPAPGVSLSLWDMAFNPNEPRDEEGRWAIKGGPGKIRTGQERLPSGNDVFYRVQWSGHELSPYFKSTNIQTDEEEDATSATRSFRDLMQWISSVGVAPIGDVEIVAFEGDEIGTGSDNEPLVQPTKELARYRNVKWKWSAHTDKLLDLSASDPNAALGYLLDNGWREMPIRLIDPENQNTGAPGVSLSLWDMAFNPNEPRDRIGEWTKSGNSNPLPVVNTEPPKALPQVSAKDTGGPKPLPQVKAGGDSGQPATTKPAQGVATGQNSAQGASGTPSVAVTGQFDPQEVNQALQRICGKGFTVDKVPALIGAQPGSHVEVSLISPGNRANSVFIKMTGEGYEAHREIRQDEGIFKNTRSIHNETFYVKHQGNGVGCKIFTGQVEQASKAGFAYISCVAGKGEGQGQGEGKEAAMNGYYTWPRLGYDAPLDQKHVDCYNLAKKAFPKARSVLDIFATPGGPEWWKLNGTQIRDARFDLRPGSRSLQTLAEYRKRKAAQQPAQPKA